MFHYLEHNDNKEESSNHFNKENLAWNGVLSICATGGWAELGDVGARLVVLWEASSV